MKKTLIYHLYVQDGFENNIANKIHWYALHLYSYIFDEIRFSVAMDDVNDERLMCDAVKWITSIHFEGEKTISFIENNELREVETFKRQILDGKDNLDGYVFFAHNKSSTNILNPDGSINNAVLTWLACLYYYNLETIHEVEDVLSGNFRAAEVFYGAFMLYFTKERTNMVHSMPNNISGLEYPGTFYWINIPKYKNSLKMGIVKDVEADSRFFAEEYPGMFFERYAYGAGMRSHNDVMFEATNFNPYFSDWTPMLNALGDKEGFSIFMNNIQSFINR